MTDTSPKAVRRDLRFLRWYAHTVKHVMLRYRAAAHMLNASTEPGNVLGRVERELAAESRRMRWMLRAIVAVVLMPFLLAGFLWSGMYWLPVTIPWFPFEREMYGLPAYSLFEWFAFLSLAAFLVFSAAVIVDGYASTRRISADYQHLADLDSAGQLAIADEARSGLFPRATLVLARAKPFEAYAAILAPSAEQPGTSA